MESGRKATIKVQSETASPIKHYNNIADVDLDTIPLEYKGQKTTKMGAMLSMIRDGELVVDTMNPKDW